MLDLIPEKWKQDPDIESVWITAFEVLRLDKSDFKSKNPIVVSLDDLQSVFIIAHGGLSYFEIKANFQWIEKDSLLKFTPERHEKRIDDTAFVLIGSVYEQKNTINSEASVAEKINALAGLLALQFGRNIIFRKLYDYGVNLSNYNVFSTSEIFINPASQPKPVLDEVQLLNFEEMISCLSENSDKNRLLLSLESFYDATSGRSSNKFISYWLALEILCMPTSNIGHARALLAKRYNLDYEVVKRGDIFLIGLMHGVRSNIVHNGHKFPFHQDLEKYINFLYKDLFLETLGMPIDINLLSIFEANKEHLRTLLKK